ncbi:hypothetical protein [Pleionea sp. CnH1-48]|uniref:hypothetical protein n=1 Tax=Pleionea sp. CnH1-48 TaxID=2954494 RepID=UPI00209697E4|nr:hypothetical protein [Pleionea sp. CnH1-48]
MLAYKGFVAQIEYDPLTDCIVGEVVNAPDVLIFEGVDLDTLKRNFYKTVDDYMHLYPEYGGSSVHPFVGRYTVCISAIDQQRLLSMADRESVSVHQWLNRELQVVLSRKAAG